MKSDLERLIVGTGPNAVPEGAVGLDINPEYILRSRERSVTGNVVLARAEALPFRDDTFKRIICWEVLEHIQDKRKALDEMTRVAQDGARVELSVALMPFERFLGLVSKKYKETVVQGFHREALASEDYLALLPANLEVQELSYDRFAAIECLWRCVLMHWTDANWIDSGEFVGKQAQRVISVARFMTRLTWRPWNLWRRRNPGRWSKSLVIHAQVSR